MKSTRNKYGKILSTESAVNYSDKLKRIINPMRLKGCSFTTVEVGNSYKIIYSDGVCRTGSNDSIKGYKYGWVNSMVMNDVSKMVSEKLYKPVNEDNNRNSIKTILFNADNIYSHCGIMDDVVSIDISACYITTLHNIGALSDRSFNKIMSKCLDIESTDKDDLKAFKVAMSSAVGSLGAVEVIRRYKDGELDLDGIEFNRRGLNIVRLDVIDKVWSVAMDIINTIPDGFFMFLTDCFYVKREYADLVMQMLDGHGYSYKSEYAYFKNIEINKGYSINTYKVTFVKESNVKKNAEDQRDSIDSYIFFSSKNCVGYVE